MNSSSLATAMLATSFALAWSAGGRANAAVQGAPAPVPAAPPSQEAPEQNEPPAGDGKAKHEGPRLEFGRAQVKVHNIEQGNAHTVIVRAESVGTAPAHLTKVTIRGEGVSASFVRNKVGKAIESGKVLDPAVEVPSGKSSRIDVVLDPAGLKIGDHAAVLELESDGNDGQPLVLPIDWEIVAPLTDEADDPAEKPAAKRNAVLKEIHTSGPPPRFDCDPQRWVFGRVLRGERVKTQFKISNKGDGDLILQKITPQCHCTLPRLILPDGVVPKKVLQGDQEIVGTLKPGQEATLEVEVDSAGMGGHGHKLVQVFTNDLANSPFQISLELDIDNPFDLSPQSVNIDAPRHGTNEKRVVRMSSTAEVGEFAINGYELPQPPVFDVEYRKLKPRKNEVCAWEITLLVRDDAPCKEFWGKLKLDLDHPRIRGTDINYRLRVLPDVDWIDGTSRSPETITLGLVRPGLNDTRSIFLENKNRAVPYVPTSVTIESPLGTAPFKAELVPIEAGQRYEIKFAVVSAPPGRAINGVLVIKSDNPQMKELRVKFTGIWNDTSAPPNRGASAPAKGH